MKFRAITLAAIAFVAAASAASAGAIAVKKKVEVSGSPDAVWKVANEFCSIKTWGGVFSGCTQHMKDGVVWRELTIKDGGGKVLEKLTDVDDDSYSYSIVDAPLPLKNHEGKIWVEKGPKDGTTLVRWEVSYDVKDGGDVQKTNQAIDGILTTGLTNIKMLAEKSAAR